MPFFLAKKTQKQVCKFLLLFPFSNHISLDWKSPWISGNLFGSEASPNTDKKLWMYEVLYSVVIKAAEHRQQKQNLQKKAVLVVSLIFFVTSKATLIFLSLLSSYSPLPPILFQFCSQLFFLFPSDFTLFLIPFPSCSFGSPVPRGNWVCA